MALSSINPDPKELRDEIKKYGTNLTGRPRRLIPDEDVTEKISEFDSFTLNQALTEFFRIHNPK